MDKYKNHVVKRKDQLYIFAFKYQSSPEVVKANTTVNKSLDMVVPPRSELSYSQQNGK